MTFRVILRKDVIYKNNTSPLCLLFFHDNRRKSVGLGVSAVPKYWDADAQKVMDDCPDRDDIQSARLWSAHVQSLFGTLVLC